MRVLSVGVPASLIASMRAEGYTVDLARDGQELLSMVRHYDFSAVLLNLQLPDVPGSDLIRQMRAARVNAPVLAFSASMRPEPRIAALTAGADDVVAMPTDSLEVLARLRAIVRRHRGHSRPILTAGPVSVCLETHEVTVNGATLNLTGKETAILELLMLRRNTALSKETFLNHLYGGMDEPEAKIIDVFICKIRKKLATAGVPDLIGTVWGCGYTIRDRRESYAPVRPSFDKDWMIEVA